MWVRSPRPRRITTLLVTLGFLVFAGYSIRNIVFIGPVLALQIAWTAPNRSPTPLRLPVALAGAAAVAAALVAAVLGPARDDPTLGFPVADYAIAHPPKHGRIVTYAGVGSYINWRSPKTRVVLNGWLEQYPPQVLRDNYGVLRAWTADYPGAPEADPRRRGDHPRRRRNQAAGGGRLPARVHLARGDLPGPRAEGSSLSVP